MSKIIKATFSQKCTGCELCVYEVQQQLKNIGLEGSAIRIFRNLAKNPNGIEFIVEIDPSVTKLNLEKIKNICPNKVFNIVEQGHEFGH